MHGGDVNAVQFNEKDCQKREDISCLSYGQGIHAPTHLLTGYDAPRGSG